MVRIDAELSKSRARIGWWLLIVVLAAAAAFIAYSFVQILVLGIFGYYATRPIDARFKTEIDSDAIAAAATLLLVLLPILLLLFYTGFQLFQQITQLFGSSGSVPVLTSDLGLLPTRDFETLMSIVQNPREILNRPREELRTVTEVGLGVFSALANAMLLIVLAVTLSYFLLEHDEEIAGGLENLFGGRDTAAYAYATAVDRDLHAVFFGNFLFVIVMAVIAAVTYWGTNLLAPQGLRVPMVLVLAVLTGAASLIPIVVGKVVYLPIVAYLGLQATRLEGDHLAFVGGALVVYFFVLDILPQTFLQPYIAGRQIDMVLMLFAYLLGPILFGWYGFFLMPIIFILILEATRIALPVLIHGEALTPTVSMGDSVGATPADVKADASQEDETDTNGGT